MSYDQQGGQNPAPDVHSKPGAGAWFAPHAASPGGSDWDDDSKSPQATSNIPNQQQAHLQPHKAVYGPGTGNGPAGAQHHQKTERRNKRAWHTFSSWMAQIPHNHNNNREWFGKATMVWGRGREECLRGERLGGGTGRE